MFFLAYAALRGLKGWGSFITASMSCCLCYRLGSLKVAFSPDCCQFVYVQAKSLIRDGSGWRLGVTDQASAVRG